VNTDGGRGELHEVRDFLGALSLPDEVRDVEFREGLSLRSVV